MKGDMSTLRKVCTYASSVLLAGEVAIAVLTAATVVLGVGSFFDDSFKDVLVGFIGVDVSTAVSLGSSFLMALVIFVMGFVTVFEVRAVMVSITREHSPFTLANAARMKVLSLTYLPFSVLLAGFGILGNASFQTVLFTFLGCILVSVVMYCLTIVFRYGAQLQKESDETL